MVENRYLRIPDPKCNHVRKGIVSAGDPLAGAHAATNVCDREACIEDAKEWAWAVSRQEPVFIADKPKASEPSLFDGASA